MSQPTTPASICKNRNESFEKTSGAQTICTATGAATVPAAFVLRSSLLLNNKYNANSVIELPTNPTQATNTVMAQTNQSTGEAFPGRPFERRYNDAAMPKSSKAPSAVRPATSIFSSSVENL